jgi:hypothetical protein
MSGRVGLGHSKGGIPMRRMDCSVAAAALTMLFLVLVLTCPLAADGTPPTTTTTTPGPTTINIQVQGTPTAPTATPASSAPPKSDWAVEWFWLPDGTSPAAVDDLTAALTAALVPPPPTGREATSKESGNTNTGTSAQNPPMFSARRATVDAREWLIIAGSKAQRDAVWKALNEASTVGALGEHGGPARRAKTWQLDRGKRTPAELEHDVVSTLNDAATEPVAGRYRLAGSTLMVWADEGEATRIEAGLKAVKVYVPPDAAVSQTVRLYYVRDPASLKAVLDAVKPVLAPEVVITPSAATGGYASLTFAGSYESIRNLRRAVAAIDLPHPTVRFELWSVQLSGSKAQRVAELADEMRGSVAVTQQLMSGYLHALRGCAGTLWDQARDGKGATFRLLNLDFLSSLNAELPAPSALAAPHHRLDYTIPPDEDHVLSLSEVLLAYLAVDGDRWSGERAGARSVLETELSTWYAREKESTADDPDAREALGNWLRLLARSRGLELPAGDPCTADWDEVWPLVRPDVLLRILCDQPSTDTARGAVYKFASEYETFIMQPDRFSPYYLADRAANLDQYLQIAERALSQDLDRIFVQPLLDGLGGEVAGRDDRGETGLASRHLNRIGGMASVGHTTLTVISDTTATVTGSAVSYFDVSALPQLDAKVLENAAGISAGLQKALLGSGTGAPQLTDLWGSQWQLPVVNLASLAMALGQEQETWSVLREGAELEFTPYILPGATRAEVNVHAIVAHDDPAPPPTGSTAPAETSLHLTRVAKHEASTTVYLDTYDLFDLSTLALRTTHPRPDLRLPVLGQLPFIGSIFSFPRNPRAVHHESLLIVRASIVPTAMDVARLHPIEPPRKTGP